MVLQDVTNPMKLFFDLKMKNVFFLLKNLLHTIKHY